MDETNEVMTTEGEPVLVYALPDGTLAVLPAMSREEIQDELQARCL